VQHSEWSPSGFKQVMLCPGSKVMQAGAPRTTSEYAAEGTAAHMLLTECLNSGNPALHYLGQDYVADGFAFTVDEDTARHVQVTLDYVDDLVSQGGVLLVDRRVHFGGYIDQPDEISFGTLDVAVILGAELISIDFKYGRGVEVSAGCSLTDQHGGVVDVRPNPQLALYGLGILAEVKDIADIERVRLVISQPRINTKPSEYDLPVEKLEAWGYGAARAAVNTARIAADTDDLPAEEWSATFLSPGEEQCRFCKAKATCPALRDEVAETVLAGAASLDEFVSAIPQPALEFFPGRDSEWLSACLVKVDLIEDWCKAVRAEVERRLLAGEAVPGYKVVQGKMGNRSWADPKQAEDFLRKTLRLTIEQVYDLSLISPTSAEKLHKAGTIGPRQWPKVEQLITRKQGKPHVAPLSDPRPPLVITPVIDEFEAAGPDVGDGGDFS
jgi:Protein of unknown function (DUF2800)